MTMSSNWKKAIEGFKLLFGQEPELEKFDGRMTFQKTSYLLKRLGVQFEKIEFTWYHRGPYSFEIGGTQPHYQKSEPGLTEKEKELVQKNKNHVLEFLKDADQAELYSSIAYLAFEEGLNEEKTVHKMGLMKPWFNVEQVKEARKKIIGFFGQPA